MLLDRPQIVEGSVIVNLVVPSAPSASPDPGELYFSGGILHVYDGSTWGSLSTSGSLGVHTADYTVHLTSDQNTFLDGLNLPTLTATEVNYVHGVTSPIQTQINSANSALSTHTSDATVHITSAQNTFLDALNLPTLTAASVNALPAHLTDYTMHLTSSQNTLIDGITVTYTDINSIPTITSNLSSLTSSFNTHAADASLHLTSSQNTFLDAITVSSADVNRLTGLDAYLTSISSASLASTLSTLFSTKLSLTGGTMTGTIVMSSGSKVTGLPLPTLDTDAASKAYVDALAGGIDWKQAVKAATTANITLFNTQTIDGVAVTVGDRVLVKDQSSSSQNGIYVVSADAWTRASDYDSALEISQSAVYVLAGGTTNGRGSFVQTNNITTVGTDAITFTAFSGPVINSAGNGINLAVGGTVSVKEGAGITFDGSSNVAVDTYTGGGLMTTTDGTNASTATAAQLSLTKVGTAGTYKSVTVDAYGRATAGTNPTTLAGFGITDAVLKTGDTMTGTLNVGANIQLVASSGNVNVGTTVSTGRFNVSGTSGNVLANFGLTADGERGMYITATGSGATGTTMLSTNGASYQMLFGINGTERMRIDSSGNVGIGGTPTYKLTVVGGDLDVQNGLIRRSGVAIIKSSGTETMIGPGGSGAVSFHNSSAVTAVDEVARFDANGNFVLGTGALTTTATNGFLYTAVSPGTPTGTPTSYSGRVPMVFNSANSILYFYNGSAWVGTGSSSVAFTSITGLPLRTTWNTTAGAYNMAVGQLAWKNGGNGYSIFDASAGTSPDGTSINNSVPANAWATTYPTLMGWDGTSTYGVRVDNARIADNVSSVSSAVGGTYTWTGVNNFRSNSNTGSVGVNTNPNGLHVYSDNSSGAIMSFARNGVYAVNMGLDSDNVFRIGGWSAPGSLLQLDMAGLLTVPSIKTTGYTYNGATYKYGYSLNLSNTDASAGKRLLLTIPAGMFQGKVRVYTGRATNDGSSSNRARWTFKVVRGGGNTGSFAFFNVESAEEDFNMGSYQWYFDQTTGNAYLRFGQAGNSFQWNVETVFSVDVTTVTPTLTLDAGTAPSGTSYNPSRIISSSNVAGSNVLALGTAGAERMRFDGSGNLMIGTTTANAKMYLVGGGSSSDTFRVDNSSSSATIVVRQSDALGTNTSSRPIISLQRGSTTSLNLSADGTTQGVVYYDAVSSTGQHIFTTNATERFRIDNVGNVSIGGLTPVETLTVGTTTNSSNITLGLRTRTSGSAVTRTLVTQGADTGSLTINWDVGNVGSEGALILKGSSSERLRISNTGKITAAPTIASDAVAILQNLSSTGNGVRFDGGNGSSTYALSVRNYVGTELMQVNGAGQVAINTTPVTNTKFFVNGTVAQNVTAVAASAIDWSAGNYHTKTVSGATTFTFTNLPSSGFAMITLKITNGGSATVTWPTVKWNAGAAPTLTASGIDIINFFTDDGGTTVYGILAGKGMA